MVNLYVDSSNKQDKYNESKLENLLLEWLFKDTDRKGVFKKVEERLFKQKAMWKDTGLYPKGFPNENWLRDTLKKVISNIATKDFKGHAEDNFGEKGDKEHHKWSALKMKEFPNDFKITNLNDSGKVDEVVGKTTLDTRKILDRRYKLNTEDKQDILDSISDDTSISVSFQQKQLGGKKGTSQNISQAILSYPDIEITKEHIFERNNIDFDLVELTSAVKEEREEMKMQVPIVDWPIISNFNNNEAAAITKIKEVFWTEENIKRVLEDIFNPYVNYEIDIKMVIDIPQYGAATLIPKGGYYYPKATLYIHYEPVQEIRRLKKGETEGVWNPAREVYLGQVKERYNWLNKQIDNLPQNDEEE